MRRHRCAAPRWIKKKKKRRPFRPAFFSFCAQFISATEDPKNLDAKTGEAR